MVVLRHPFEQTLHFHHHHHRYLVVEVPMVEIGRQAAIVVATLTTRGSCDEVVDPTLVALLSSSSSPLRSFTGGLFVAADPLFEQVFWLSLLAGWLVGSLTLQPSCPRSLRDNRCLLSMTSLSTTGPHWHTHPLYPAAA